MWRTSHEIKSERQEQVTKSETILAEVLLPPTIEQVLKLSECLRDKARGEQCGELIALLAGKLESGEIRHPMLDEILTLACGNLYARDVGGHCDDGILVVLASLLRNVVDQGSYEVKI